MNENVKTLTFVGAAIVAVAIGGFANFSSSNSQETALAAGLLFPDFTDPLKARSLEIITFDQDTATLHPFKVAQVKGKWVIPSHENYPADAAQHLADAAANLIEAKRLNVQSEDPSKHEEYGVVDPSSKQLTAGSTGVGKRVQLQDKANKTLADLIIGKELKDKPDLHYVRIPDQAPVYVASIKTDKFTTKFEDWIEKDLLKLNPIELERVGINDYSVDELQGVIHPRSQISVEYDSKALKWNLIELAEFEGGDWAPVKLADDEQLNAQKLNDMKTALDDLKIVDVSRKPAGLAADFKAGEKLAGNEESKISLARRGFHLGSVGEGPTEIFSNEGEVRAGTKDGVEYVLRFGRIAGAGSADDGDESKEDGESEQDKSGTGVNRYIMVTAEFNKELIPEPELLPLPDEQPAGGEAEGDENTEAGKTDAGKTDAGNADAKQDDAKQDDAKQDDAKKDEPDKKAEAKPDPAKAKAERERIEKENKRLQDDYDAKVKKGEERAKELSGRFADWYYVISDATYQKIHLGREAIVEKKPPPPGEAGKDQAKESENTLNDLKQLPK